MSFQHSSKETWSNYININQSGFRRKNFTRDKNLLKNIDVSSSKQHKNLKDMYAC
jgi:hypothetical protein